MFSNIYCLCCWLHRQVLLLLTILLVLAVTGVFLPRRRGSFNSLLLFSFALTSSVSGFWSSMLYAQMDGKHFALNAIASFLVFVGTVTIRPPLFLFRVCVMFLLVPSRKCERCGSIAYLLGDG